MTRGVNDYTEGSPHPKRFKVWWLSADRGIDLSIGVTNAQHSTAREHSWHTKGIGKSRPKTNSLYKLVSLLSVGIFLLAACSATRQASRPQSETPQHTMNSIGPMAVDNSGNVFIANNNWSNPLVHVWSGSPDKGYQWRRDISIDNVPLGLAVNSTGDLFISQNSSVHILSAADRYTKVTKITLSSGNTPNGVAVDKDDNVFIADGFGVSIWSPDPVEYKQTGSVSPVQQSFIRSVALDNGGNLFIGYDEQDNGPTTIWSGNPKDGYTQSANTIPDSGHFAVDSKGTVFMATAWQIVSVWSGSPAAGYNSTNARIPSTAERSFQYPAVDQNDNVFIAATSNTVSVWHGTPTTGYTQVQTIGGPPPPPTTTTTTTNTTTTTTTTTTKPPPTTTTTTQPQPYHMTVKCGSQPCPSGLGVLDLSANQFVGIIGSGGDLLVPAWVTAGSDLLSVVDPPTGRPCLGLAAVNGIIHFKLSGRAAPFLIPHLAEHYVSCEFVGAWPFRVSPRGQRAGPNQNLNGGEERDRC